MPYWSSFLTGSCPPHIFKSLDIEIKCELVRELMKLRKLYCVSPQMFGRPPHKRDLGPVPLNKNELMMIGELDQSAADDLVSPSLDKAMMMLYVDSDEAAKVKEEALKNYAQQCQNFISRGEEFEHMEEYYIPLTFKQQLGRFENLPTPSTYNEEFFVDKKLKKTDDAILKTYLPKDYKMGLMEGLNVEEYFEMMKELESFEQPTKPGTSNSIPNKNLEEG